MPRTVEEIAATPMIAPENPGQFITRNGTVVTVHTKIGLPQGIWLNGEWGSVGADFYWVGNAGGPNLVWTTEGRNVTFQDERVIVLKADRNMDLVQRKEPA